MRRRDAHVLTNLSLPVRLLVTTALVAGSVLFCSAWLALVAVTGWGLSLAALFDLGEGLATLGRQSTEAFLVLLAVHFSSVLLVVGVLRALLNRLAMARGFRTALLLTCSALALGDLGLWLLLPYVELARDALAPFLVVFSVVLVGMAVFPLRELWLFTRWRRDGEPLRVLVVGGGFGGLHAALGLDARLGYHPKLEVTLLDRRNYFLFPPLLPSVATGAIETRQVTLPFRRALEGTNVRFRKDNVVAIDLAAKLVRTRTTVGRDAGGAARVSEAALPYDVLVLAPGSTVNTFGTPGVAEHAFFMRELGDAVAFRNHVIDCFEHAARETDPGIVRELLRFVIVGGGPTGVEVAAELQDLVEAILLPRYPEVNPTLVEVFLVQSAPRLIPGWHDKMANVTEDQLTRMHVKLLLGTRVQAVDATGVTLAGGETLRTRTCVWAAGVKMHPLLDGVDLPRAKDGRIEVDATLRPPGHAEVFVCGDAACVSSPASPRGLPPLAQVALQQGEHLGKSLVRALRGQEPRPFRYFDYGALLAVGERFAVVSLMGLRLDGFVGWFLWRTLYLVKLVGFGNKVRVVLDWTMDLLVERSFAQIRTERYEEP